MITEIAMLHIKRGEGKIFEMAFTKAQVFISSADGYISHELLSCIEEIDKYVLIVRWRSVEDHVNGFRNSSAYQEWKKLLHHFYEPFPVVEHYYKPF